MPEERTITWTDKSGTQYKYWIHPPGTTFKNSPGNYMFIKETEQNRFKTVYVGETEDLGDRLDNLDGHHKWACAKKEGATHVCAHTNDDGEEARRTEEQDLIKNYGPKCND